MSSENAAADNQHLSKSPAMEEVDVITSDLVTVRTCILFCFLN